MKYIVMECFDSYSVVLDNEGRFLKVANMNYEVGQRLDHVYAMEEPKEEAEKVIKLEKKNPIGILSGLAAIAAAFMLVITSLLPSGGDVVGSLYMTINPDIRLDIDKEDKVVAIEGLNPDGKDLLDSYVYKDKDYNLVVDELLDKAIEKGYLYDAGKVSIRLDGGDTEWVNLKSNTISEHLKERADKGIKFEIEVNSVNISPEKKEIRYQDKNEEIVIPLDGSKKTYDDTDYGDTDYDEKINKTNDNQSYIDSDDTDYDTDYDDTDYDQTYYEDDFTDYGLNDNISNYDSSPESEYDDQDDTDYD